MGATKTGWQSPVGRLPGCPRQETRDKRRQEQEAGLGDRLDKEGEGRGKTQEPQRGDRGICAERRWMPGERRRRELGGGGAGAWS